MFKRFLMSEGVVAPRIYGFEEHYTTSEGYVLNTTIREEIEVFLQGFNAYVGVKRTPYYRIDAYPNTEGEISILEINAAFVDGWGTALNLARASGLPVHGDNLTFPQRFTCLNQVYMPELELFLKELAIFGHEGTIVTWEPTPAEDVFVYGRVRNVSPHIIPYDGVRIDDKHLLAGYSQKWKGDKVHVPYHYLYKKTQWDDIPTDAILKFADKGSDECARARWSVHIGRPLGKAKFLRWAYHEGKLLAQDFVEPMRHNNRNIQLVILAIGHRPVAGYVQFSSQIIINDNSVHGPLMIQ